MDPIACVQEFIRSVLDGDYERAAECQEAYESWLAKCGVKACIDGRYVERLDLEQDRYLVNEYGQERWVRLES